MRRRPFFIFPANGVAFPALALQEAPGPLLLPFCALLAEAPSRGCQRLSLRGEQTPCYPIRKHARHRCWSEFLQDKHFDNHNVCKCCWKTSTGRSSIFMSRGVDTPCSILQKTDAFFHVTMTGTSTISIR